MIDRAHIQGVIHEQKLPRLGRRLRRVLRVGASAALLLAFLASSAFAAHFALTLGSASNATLGKSLVVSSQGRTLYALSPETSKHLLCKNSECFSHWPPLTVKSSKTKLKDGTGVEGRLGILRRSNGMLQVTLRGLPLYRYAGDHANGQANGEGLESFGGKWHAVTAASNEAASKPVTPSMSPEAPSYPASTPTTPSVQPAAPTTSPPTTTSTPTTTPPPATPPPYVYPAY
jgi:predicted lipoprotein with Yx(FWY)xxD motif